MINNFKTDLIIRVAAQSQDETLTAMGYARPTSANRRRLQSVLECSDFWLSEAGFDFKYLSEDFLRALCRAARMDESIVDKRIRKLIARMEEERGAFKPYVWVDTGFVRKNLPLFALAVCEHQRYLGFSEGFWRYSLTEQLGHAQAVFAHMSLKQAESLASGARSSSIGFTTKRTQPTFLT